VRGGTGACFRLFLPVAEEGRREEPSAAGAGNGPAARRTPGAPRALVVDDESSVRSLVARLLARNGYDVAQAADGEEALLQLERETFDLVLCDVRMPKLNGRALFAAIRSRRPDLAASFILMTGDTLSADVADFAAEHRIPLLTKPFTAKELDDVLAKLA